MSLKDKLRHWMDQWVGATEITPLPEGISPSMESGQDLRAHHSASTSPVRGKTLQMQDIFFLNPRSEDLKPKDTVALYLPEREAIVVRDPRSGEIDRLIPFKHAQGLVPLWGRFGENGQESVALYDPQSGYFRIWDSLDHPKPLYEFLFGPPGLGWLPLIGDWTGQGRDGIGLYCPETSTFLLKNIPEGGEPDRVFMFGAPNGWKPLVGDWNGDGQSGVGLLNAIEGVFYLKNALEGGDHEFQIQLSIKDPDLMPISGDWNGRGRDTVGVFDRRNNSFYLDNSEDNSSDWPQHKYGVSDDPAVPLRIRLPSGTQISGANVR